MNFARRTQPGADGRAAQVHHPQAFLALGDPPAIAGDRVGKGTHAATERRQHRVLQLGAATLTMSANSRSLA